MTRDEQLIAWLDGELPAAEAAALEAELAADPTLAARLDQLQASDAQLRAAFDDVLHQPVPDRLTALLAEPNTVIDFVQAREKRAAARALPAWLDWRAGSAIAASLLVGLAGLYAFQEAGPGRSDAIEVALDAALETTPSGQSAQLASGVMTPRLSFAARDGRYCREFDQAGTTAIACRSAKGWAIEAKVKRPDDASSEGYATAGGAQTLDPVYQRLGGGDPLDITQERVLMARGWHAGI